MDRQMILPFLSSYGVDCQDSEIVTVKGVRPHCGGNITCKQESGEQHLKVRPLMNSLNYDLRFFQCSYGTDSTSNIVEVCGTSNSTERENSIVEVCGSMRRENSIIAVRGSMGRENCGIMKREKNTSVGICGTSNDTPRYV